MSNFIKGKQDSKKSTFNTDVFVKTAEPTEQFAKEKPSVAHLDYRKEKISIPTVCLIHLVI